MDSYDVNKRRNLLLTSILLFLISYAGIEIKNDLSITPVKFHIKDPIVIYLVLWGLYLYFLVRFIQVVLSSNDKDASYARDLMGLTIPPFYTLRKDIYNDWQTESWLTKTWNFVLFLFTYIFQIIMMVFRAVFEKNFFEYIFPVLFAIIVGFLSYKSSFMESKKYEIEKRIDAFICVAKLEFYESLMPNPLKKYIHVDLNCSKSKQKEYSKLYNDNIE